MNKLKLLRRFFITALGVLFFVRNSYANIVFPAITHQFMISAVVRSYWSIVMAISILIIETFFIQKLFAINYIIFLITLQMDV